MKEEKLFTKIKPRAPEGFGLKNHFFHGGLVLIVYLLTISVIFPWVIGMKSATPAQAATYFDTSKDTRPPKLSGLAIEVKSQGFSDTQKAQIIASWQTDEPATSFVELGEGISGDNYSTRTQEDMALSNSHVVIVSQLDPNRIYHIRAASHDSAGNIGYTADTTVITGKVQNSVLDLIMQSLQKSLGWLSGFIFTKN